MHAFGRIDPVTAQRPVSCQHVPGEDSVPTGILHVHMEICAVHGHDDVEVDLQVAGNALFDGEIVRFLSGVPAADLSECEDGGHYD